MRPWSTQFGGRVKNASLAAIVVSLLACIPRQASAADSYEFLVPGRPWAVAFTMPPLTEYQAQSDGENFHFQGDSSGGVIVSFFVEPSSLKTSEDCRSDYW